VRPPLERASGARGLRELRQFGRCDRALSGLSATIIRFCVLKLFVLWSRFGGSPVSRVANPIGRPRTFRQSLVEREHGFLAFEQLLHLFPTRKLEVGSYKTWRGGQPQCA
jgi:hypothetical protein